MPDRLITPSQLATGISSSIANVRLVETPKPLPAMRSVGAFEAKTHPPIWPKPLRP
jgi:hypothetical protein